MTGRKRQRWEPRRPVNTEEMGVEDACSLLTRSINTWMGLVRLKFKGDASSEV